MSDGLRRLCAEPTRSTAATPRLPMPMPPMLNGYLRPWYIKVPAAAADTNNEPGFHDVETDRARLRMRWRSDSDQYRCCRCNDRKEFGYSIETEHCFPPLSFSSYELHTKQDFTSMAHSAL